MADLENNKRSFESEGIDLRFKQKPIPEDAPQSRYKEVNLGSSARIFLHSDGRVYFRDNEVQNPVPLEKLENIYERVRVEEGELRFYNRELTDFINLSQVAAEKTPFQKNNSLIHSETRTWDFDEGFDGNYILEESFSNFSNGITSNINDVYNEADINVAKNRFGNAFETNTVDILEDKTVMDTLFDHFLTGIVNLEPLQDVSTSGISGITGISGFGLSGTDILTLEQLLEMGYDSFEDYFNQTEEAESAFIDEDGEFTWESNFILPDMEIFLGDLHIGLEEQPEDILGKRYFGNTLLSDFDNYMFDNLYKYNGIGKYIHSIFDSPPLSGWETTPYVSDAGIFEGLSVQPITHEILEDISKVFAYMLYNKFLEEYHVALNDANLLVDGVIRPGENVLNAPTMYEMAETARQAMDNPTFRQELIDSLEMVFSEDKTSLLNLSTLFEFQVGGLFLNRQLAAVDWTVFNDVWYDVPNFHHVTPAMSNKSAICVTAHFPVNVKQRRNTRYEFRLIDTVANVELDRVVLESEDFENLNFERDIFSTKIHTHPIQLSYFGPVPEFSCDEKNFSECFSGNTDVLTHVKISTDDCVTANPIGEESGFRNIADRFLANITTEVDSNDTIQVDTPRIFRVQFRAVYLDENDSILTHRRTLSNITFGGKTTRNAEARISVDVFNVGSSDANRIIRQGVVPFNFDKRKPIEFDFVLNTEEDYSITLIANKNIKVWYDDKSSHGFTIKAEKEFEGEVSWLISKRPGLQESSFDKDLPPCFVESTPSYGSLSNFDIFRKAGYDI